MHTAMTLLATVPLKGLALGELENVLFLVCLWRAPTMPKAGPTESHFQTTIAQSHQILRRCGIVLPAQLDPALSAYAQGRLELGCWLGSRDLTPG